ncbi:hypothetical protein FRC00_003673 [Tulasnella sp. 408]|nr:hypothetical protein FRC00_003673 [Tulasnella sp. 408]
MIPAFQRAEAAQRLRQRIALGEQLNKVYENMFQDVQILKPTENEAQWAFNSGTVTDNVQKVNGLLSMIIDELEENAPSAIQTIEGSSLQEEDSEMVERMTKLGDDPMGSPTPPPPTPELPPNLENMRLQASEVMERMAGGGEIEWMGYCQEVRRFMGRHACSPLMNAENQRIADLAQDIRLIHTYLTSGAQAPDEVARRNICRYIKEAGRKGSLIWRLSQLDA